jgi:GNAT superfamily N-acetyltransferase
VSNAITLRVAAVDDAPAIAETFVEAARAAWRHLAPPDLLDAMPPPTATWAERLGQPAAGDRVLVAEVDHDVVGFVWATPHGDEEGTGSVETVYTRPRVWGSGVGRALLDAAVVALRGAGCREVTLWTEARNHRPRRVYEAHGWRVDGATREREFLGAPISEVRYRLKV